MTLIETTVALALLALLSIGLVTSSGSASASTAVTRRFIGVGTVAVQRFLRQTSSPLIRVIRNAGDPTTEFGLEGAPRSCTSCPPAAVRRSHRLLQI